VTGYEQPWQGGQWLFQAWQKNFSWLRIIEPILPQTESPL